MASPDDQDGYGLDSRTCNPFNDKSPEYMEQCLDKFMKQSGVEDMYRLHFRKGMYIAQHPKSLDRPPPGEPELELTQEERDLLRQDQIATTDQPETWGFSLKKWRLPSPLWRLVTLCALGAVVQGWDEAAVNSAQSYYQDAYNIHIDILDPTSEGSTPIVPRPWLVGLVNSAPYLCCVFSCWLTHPLNAAFGRRWTIFISCLFSAAFAFAQSFAQSWQVMFGFRFLLGLGIGPKSATIPIYTAEAAPQNVRGGLVMMWQIFTALGIMCGYIAGVAFNNVGANCAPSDNLLSTSCSLKWRLMIGSPGVAPVVLMMYIFTQPESPRWLIGKGHHFKANGNSKKAQRYYQKAFEGFIRLRHSKLQAARDMFLVYHQLEKQEREIQSARLQFRWYERGFFELFTNHRNRRAFFASLICMFAQQFCGVNLIVYYSGEVLKRTKHISAEQIVLYSLGFGIINFVFALPAFYTIDTFGRWSLLLITFPFLALSQLLTAIAFVGPDKGDSTQGTGIPQTAQWRLAIVGMYLFGVAYSPGEGPVPFVYSAESMPLYIRDIGMGCVTSVNWFFNWLIAITAPEFFQVFQSWGAFLWYAAWCVVLWFLILFFVPETRLLSLEQLDSIFNQSTPNFWHFVVHEELAWVWKKLYHGRSAGPRPQLYKFIQRGHVRTHPDLTTIMELETSDQKESPSQTSAQVA